MWADLHNQSIVYHGIITRGLVNLLDIWDDTHPKYHVIKHATFKAINHIIRSQRDGGTVIGHPVDGGYCGEKLPDGCHADAQQLIDPTSQILQQSVSLFTHGAIDDAYKFEPVQGHRFATLGRLLFHYYNQSTTYTADLCPTVGFGHNTCTRHEHISQPDFWQIEH